MKESFNSRQCRFVHNTHQIVHLKSTRHNYTEVEAVRLLELPVAVVLSIYYGKLNASPLS